MSNRGANPVPGDPWAMPERPSEREAQNRVDEWPSVVPAGGFSLDSVFGVGSNPVAPNRLDPQGNDRGWNRCTLTKPAGL